MARTQRTKSSKEIEPTYPNNSFRDNSTVNNNSDSDPQTRRVWLTTAILLAFLVIRFLCVLFGANPANAFVNFVYTLSYPFVVPFFSLFDYRHRYGSDRFEAYTLLAMVFYIFAAWIIIKAVTFKLPESFGDV